MGPCSGWHPGRQRGAAQGGKIPVPAHISACTHLLTRADTADAQRFSPTRSITRTQWCQEPCDGQRLWSCLWPPSNRCHTPGSGPRGPAPFHTHSRAGGSTAGNDNGTVGRTSRCLSRCDNTGHLALTPPAASGVGGSSRARDRHAGSSGGFSASLQPRVNPLLTQTQDGKEVGGFNGQGEPPSTQRWQRSVKLQELQP